MKAVINHGDSLDESFQEFLYKIIIGLVKNLVGQVNQ